MNKKYIYIISSLQTKTHRTRVWSFWNTLEDAKKELFSHTSITSYGKVIKKDGEFFYDGSYNYVLIEKVEMNTSMQHYRKNNTLFYKLVHVGDEVKIRKAKVPEEYKNVYGFF